MSSRKAPVVISTTTDEPYLPTRLVYNVHQPDALRRWFDKHPAMSWDPGQRRWTWNYDRKARKLGFPPAYDEALRRQGGLVLASCILVKKKTLHVYTRCGLRAARFLVLFDKAVPRTTASGEFVDQYNLLTTSSDPASIPAPEEFFKDESRLEFFDVASLLDGARTPAELSAVAALIQERSVNDTIHPLQRNRLEMFYEDGPEAFEQAMLFRQTMALLQHKSATPIRPFDAIKSLLESSGS